MTAEGIKRLAAALDQLRTKADPCAIIFTIQASHCIVE